MKLLVSHVKATEKKKKKKKKTNSIGWMASVLSHIDTGNLEVHAGALLFCYPKPHNCVLFYRNCKKHHIQDNECFAFHKNLRLKDSCSNSDCFSDLARYGSPSTSFYM